LEIVQEEIECFLEEKEKERFLVNWVGDCARGD